MSIPLCTGPGSRVERNRPDDSIVTLAAKTLIGERNPFTIVDLVLGQSLGSRRDERYCTVKPIASLIHGFPLQKDTSVLFTFSFAAAKPHRGFEISRAFNPVECGFCGLMCIRIVWSQTGWPLFFYTLNYIEVSRFCELSTPLCVVPGKWCVYRQILVGIILPRNNPSFGSYTTLRFRASVGFRLR